jgi:hypothetical protein
MGKGKKGQNRQKVISNTAQWAKEKEDKIEKQRSARQHKGQRKKSAVLLITVCHFVLFFLWP